MTLPITLDPEFFELLKMPSSRAIDKYYDQTYISSEERVLFEERMLQKWPKSVYDQLDYELFTFPRPDSLVLTGLPLNGAKNIKTNIWNAMIKDTYGQNIPPYEEIPAIHRALCAIGRSVFHDFVNQFNRGLQLCLQLDAMQMSMNHSIACLINERELNVEQFLLAIRYEEGPISSLLLVDSLIPGHPISLRNTFESFLRALDRQQLGKMIALWTGASGLCDLNTTHVPSVYFYHPQSESNMIVARFLPIYLKPHQITKMYPIEDINLSTSTSLKRKMPDVLENTSFSSSSAGPHVSTGISTNETSEGQLAINTDQRKLELSKTVVQSIGDLDEDSEDLDYEKETNKIQTINKNYDMDPGLSGAIIIDDRQFVRIVRAVAKEQCLILGLSCDQRVDPFESKNPTFADGVAYPTKFSTCPRIIQVPVGTAGQIVHTLLLSLNMCVRDFKD